MINILLVAISRTVDSVCWPGVQTVYISKFLSDFEICLFYFGSPCSKIDSLYSNSFISPGCIHKCSFRRHLGYARTIRSPLGRCTGPGHRPCTGSPNDQPERTRLVTSRFRCRVHGTWFRSWCVNFALLSCTDLGRVEKRSQFGLLHLYGSISTLRRRRMCLPGWVFRRFNFKRRGVNYCVRGRTGLGFFGISSDFMGM